MKRLVFTENVHAALLHRLFAKKDETCAVLLAAVHKADRGYRYLVREAHYPPDSNYDERSPISATLKPEFFIPIVQSARDKKLAVIFAHTHPGTSDKAVFSSIDDAGEVALAEFLDQRIPDIQHLALLFTQNDCAARVIGSQESVEVISVGTNIRQLSNIGESKSADDNIWDRQERIFGSSGQKRLRSLSVAVVGCGGTGSIVAEHLTYLGVQKLLLIDPDILESTNLNRVVGATLADVGSSKVNVLAKVIRQTGFPIDVETLEDDILNPGAAKELLRADVIFSCTDSYGSRALLNQIAYQYLIPVFDVGVSITASGKETTHITGRVQMLNPNVGCLVCAQALDWAEVRRDFQTAEERKRDPYIVGHPEPQPAVITLNGTMSSLATTMFLAAVTNVPANARLQYYNGITGVVRAAEVKPQVGCVVCSSSGSLLQADQWPLPTRG